MIVALTDAVGKRIRQADPMLKKLSYLMARP